MDFVSSNRVIPEIYAVQRNKLSGIFY